MLSDQGSRAQGPTRDRHCCSPPLCTHLTTDMPDGTWMLLKSAGSSGNCTEYSSLICGLLSHDVCQSSALGGACNENRFPSEKSLRLDHKAFRLKGP